MNLEKRQAQRRARKLEIRRSAHKYKMGTSDRPPEFGREYHCGPGFPKDRSKMGNDGKRKNPIRKQPAKIPPTLK